MNIKVCQKLTLFYYNLKNSFYSPQSTLSLPFSSKPINNILVCLPESLEDFRAAKTQLPTLTEVFQSSTISLLLKTDYLKLTNGARNYRLVAYSSDEFDIRGLPKKSLWQKLAPQLFEITIDFNAEFKLPIAALCRKINSPFRLTFAKPNDIVFFNIILQISGNKDYTTKLKSLLHYLQAIVGREKSLNNQAFNPVNSRISS